MTRSSSKAPAARKSLPPLPIVAAHASTSSDATLPLSEGSNIATTRRSWATTGCIRATVTILVFMAYIAWTLPWYLEHGLDDVGKLLAAGRGGGPVTGEVGRGQSIGTEGIVRAPPLGIPKSLQTKWAQYSPWHPLSAYTAPPARCNVTQASSLSSMIRLQRHGARYPNADDGETYSNAVTHLTSAQKFADKHMKWLKGYEYELGADDLVPFGAAQSFEAGGIALKRYRDLVDLHNIPFVRASGAPRVISTATNWTVGFAATSGQRYQPYLNVVISEEVNNTLNQDCPKAADGSEETDIWLSVFAPTLAARLNKAAPGAKLNQTHIFGLLAMCPFESVAKEKLSPFCTLFTEDDFRAFEYWGDLEKYYKTGYGNSLGRVRGVGYVNELIARLTGEPVQDHTTHNSTLEFPLNRTIYADFTHENLMVAVYAALGLFNISQPLDPRTMPSESRLPSSGYAHLNARQAHLQEKNRKQTWVASRMVPFSSRMVTERLSCAEDGDGEERTYVRILVNDEVQPLKFCGGGEDRMCALEDFVASQGYARRSGDGDFERCYN
ncbi:histidine phosphatase superfamily [Daedaleopsis nitida]|nr:histidine phosphatase superfamily [Daedaleopsis nitida]